MCVNDIWNKIYSGSHYTPPTTSITKFIASYYDVSPPTSAKIYIDGVANTMSLELGNSSKNYYLYLKLTKGLGTYKFETPKGSTCREYYFHFKDYKGDSFYYPETGSLLTTKVTFTIMHSLRENRKALA